MKKIIDQKLKNIVDKLEKKGFDVQSAKKASSTNVFKLSLILHDFIEENIIDVNNKDKIIKILLNQDYECTFIYFNDNYNFKSLPKGFEINDNHIFYHLSFLNSKTLEYKSLVDLDKENEDSIKELDKWADSL